MPKSLFAIIAGGVVAMLVAGYALSDSLPQPVVSKPGTSAAQAITVQGSSSGVALPVSGSVSLSGSPSVSVSNFPATQPVSGTFWQATQPVSGSFFQATQPVSGTFWQATQPVSGTFWQATQPVSGTVAATESGTWTVQPGNTANTTPWLIDLNKVAGTATVTGGLAGSQGVGGLAADGSAATGNPILAAGKGFNGIALTPKVCDKIAQVTTLSTTATVQQIAAVASQKIWVCGWLVLGSTATTATQLKFTEGTGTNCATGNTNVTPLVFTTPTAAPAVANWTYGPIATPVAFTTTAADALCITQASATNATTLSGTIYYTQN